MGGGGGLLKDGVNDVTHLTKMGLKKLVRSN